MGLATIYNKVVLLSPRIEVILRQLYWKNSGKLRKSAKGTHKKKVARDRYVDFAAVINWLKEKGVGEGSLLIVHSTYEALQCTGLEPDAIVERLLDLVGETGTLAMPAIRKFKGEPSYAERTGFETFDTICKYNTRKTKLSSGVLPYYMVLREDSEVSRFPLNPMVAIGPLAKEMMLHNIDDEWATPHGPKSAWKFCYDHNAIVVGLGASLEHYNTITHVAEEAFGDWHWSDDVWYCERTFDIVDGDFEKRINIRERKPYIGKMHFAEKNLYKDLLKNDIVKEDMIANTIPMYIENAQSYINYLRSKNKKGYPYFGNIKNKK